ncbi:uncharacterized protein LTR77_003548 [Saxophila tyrrhenica]|uniref:Uncharacterized protein n=1 Tax=Saxophila tyrrhenica TaxID=1690608 RepID=A0AAV9PGU3_9PEZI|nr:hypothetical protein LTR77_003548 [Saxophila tyrrhenica]
MANDTREASIDAPESSQKDPTTPTATEHARPSTLLVLWNDWKYRHGRLVDESSGSILYDFDNKYTQLVFRRLDSVEGDQIGTASFHFISTSAIDVRIHSTSFSLKHRDWKHRDQQWLSPAFGNQTMTWSKANPWTSSSITLLDEAQLPVAKFSPGGAVTLKQPSKIEFMGERSISQEMLDELVVTGVALMRDLINQTQASAGAKAGAAEATGDV